jgi:EAL domain-containing protein (putative c-di-GMP-specific phosphodiesterase class I)/CheY-like chemotaxis protein
MRGCGAALSKELKISAIMWIRCARGWEGSIVNTLWSQTFKSKQFGQRRTVPRVCIVDEKPHIRAFLAQAFEDLGFIAQDCARVPDVDTAVSGVPPDLVVLGLLKPESDVTKVLDVLASRRFTGKTMLFGGRASLVLTALQDFGEELGLAMLEPLRTPFRDSDLQKILSDFLPIAPAPSLPIDVAEALHNKWLELWYQPKIDLHQMSLHSATALARVRHPNWGIIPPSCFLPSDGDPRFLALSEFVVQRAMADWKHFTKTRPSIGLGIHLPMSVLEDVEFIDELCLQLPDHSVAAGLTIEISSVDVSRDPKLVRRAAKQLAVYNIGISIDDVMQESSWADIGDFPIAELQVDRAFIAGSAGDRDKRAVCGLVLGIAERIGARATAKGIETTPDFQAVCEMGFDLAQGFLFSKPMEPHKFARTVLRGEPKARK